MFVRGRPWPSVVCGRLWSSVCGRLSSSVHFPFSVVRCRWSSVVVCRRTCVRGRLSSVVVCRRSSVFVVSSSVSRRPSSFSSAVFVVELVGCRRRSLSLSRLVCRPPLSVVCGHPSLSVVRSRPLLSVICGCLWSVFGLRRRVVGQSSIFVVKSFGRRRRVDHRRSSASSVVVAGQLSVIGHRLVGQSSSVVVARITPHSQRHPTCKQQT